ncbi:type IV pilin [Natronomonas sp. LN261]|uniref:type IV pilin n=1 Tax=Natronomonas sp. LN261 TaxID=2750669 RepID=UPI0015EF31F0|nr:type IV pilin N-terminal domain-containing protein [Natronomonas sp. LN261]
MKLRQLFDGSEDERGVSPVIGVILMVAITVILAAVIGTFVLGLGDQTSSAPQASFTCESGDLVHNGGDELTDSELVVNGGSNSVESGNSPYTAGSTIVTSFVDANTLVWEDPNSDDTQILRDEGCTQP